MNASLRFSRIFLQFLLVSVYLVGLSGVWGFRSLVHRVIKPFSQSQSLKMVYAATLAEKKAQIPLKVAVIGGGVGGTMLGFALQQKGFDVTLYEKTAQFARFGGPIQLASNALSCVHALSPSLFDQIMGRFTFTGNRKCGIKDGVRNTWYSIFDAIPKLAEAQSLPYTGVIDRPDLQDILLQNLRPKTVINSKALARYEERQDGKIDLFFQDGEKQEGFDVVVGADGIWSNVRRQMWNEPSEKPGTCTYSGYTLFAAETVMDPDSDFFDNEGYFDAGYKVYIGPGKYFVTSDVGSGRIQWYAFLALPPGTKARSSNLQFVADQFQGWSHEIHACLNNTPDSIIEQRDLYDRRPSITRSWSQGGVTMLGDAAHPMMPNLGQGGCQAIEDALVLTDVLCDVTDTRDVASALQSYYRQRVVRSAAVQGLSRLSSDIIISQFTTPFNLQEFLKEGLSYKHLSPKAVMTLAMRSVLPAIFHLQFSFLYSFAPSSFDENKLQKIAKDSSLRNQREVKTVYEHLREGYSTFFTAKTMSLMRCDRRTQEITKVADASDLRLQAATATVVAGAGAGMSNKDGSKPKK